MYDTFNWIDWLLLKKATFSKTFRIKYFYLIIMHLHYFNDHVVWFSPDKFHPLDEVWSRAKPKQAKDKIA